MRIWFNKTFSTIAAVLRQLRQSSVSGDITLICTQTYDTATAFLAADECYLEPSDVVGQDYVQWCLTFCEQHNINLFWPGKEAALVSQYRAAFNAIDVQIMSVADSHTLALLHNKADFYRHVSKSVAHVMDFVAVNSSHEFDNAVAKLSVKHEKLCIKPAVSVYGLGFRILDTQRNSITHVLKGVEYQIPLQELRQGMANNSQFDTLLVMEHLYGHEWSVDCVARHGELLCAVQRKKSFLAGHGQTIDNNLDVNTMVQHLTTYYRLNGIFNIQFKEGIQGVCLLEINARPSGGFGMACLSGVNLADIALSSLQEQTVQIPAIRYGLRVNEINTPVVVSDLNAE